MKTLADLKAGNCNREDRQKRTVAIEQQPASKPSTLVPEGWHFFSADFSMQAVGKSKKGKVSLIRDVAGAKWWHSLTDEQKEVTKLYLYGEGETIELAILAAVAMLNQ